MPRHDDKLFENKITSENKGGSVEAQGHFEKYWFPFDAYHEPNYALIDLENILKKDFNAKLALNYYPTWAIFAYGPSKAEQRSAMWTGITAGLSTSAAAAVFDAIDGMISMVKNPEQVALLAQLVFFSAFSDEYRDALITMIQTSFDAWSDAYNKADPYQKGTIIGKLIGQTLISSLGTIKSVSDLKGFIKKGGFKKKITAAAVAEATAEALAKLSSAQKNALELLRSSGIKSILESGYITHLTDVAEFTQKSAIVGGHNKVKFFDYLTRNNIPIKEIARNKSSIQGIEEIVYKIASRDSAGNIIKDELGNIVWKNQEFRKTLYDPSIFTDTKMVEFGEQAMKEGIDSVRLTFQTNSNTIVEGILPIGMKFRGYWNPTTGKIDNFHPILE